MLKPATSLAEVYKTLSPEPLVTPEELEAFYSSQLNVVRGEDNVALEAGVASISGFGQVFPLGKSHAGVLASFNFKRERLAEAPMRQIWWLPGWVADAFLRGAPDLYSWFTEGSTAA